MAIFLLSQDAVRTLELQGSVLWRSLVTVWLTESYLWALLAPLVWLLLRHTLQEWESQEIPLRNEIEFLPLSRHRLPRSVLPPLRFARIALLRGRRHTSNGLEYLRSHVPGYRDEQHYVAAPAVRDSGLITASGVPAVEFARELFDESGVLSKEDRTVWAEMFRSARLPGDAS